MRRGPTQKGGNEAKQVQRWALVMGGAESAVLPTWVQSR